MPIITVDDEQSIDLFYEDSGAPAISAPYITLIILHGVQYHAEIFSKMLPLAAKHNLRLIIVNRRGYPGSSPCTASEVKSLTDGDREQQESYIVALGLRFAEFINRFIQQNDISPEGGIVTMGWSAGNFQNLSFLANLEKLPVSTRTFLEPYIKGTILYDYPMFIYGYPPPPTLYAPARAKYETTEEMETEVARWVGGYYRHDLQNKSISQLPDPTIPSTQDRMTGEEHERVFHNGEGQRTDILFSIMVRKELMRNVLERAVFQPLRTESGSIVWERVGVKVIWCEQSFGDAVTTAWEMEDMARKRGSEVGRDIEFVMLPQANHFPHWDKPEETTKFFADILYRM